MKFQAFDVLAGSSYGTWTQREVCAELLRLQDEHLKVYIDEWRTLANCSDDDVEIMGGLIDSVIDTFNDLADEFLPASCSICWRDNEITVLPFLDDQCPSIDSAVEDVPEQYVDEIIYMINDHGNVDCYEWDGKNYVHQWGMV
jgi:hypothetical protein